MRRLLFTALTLYALQASAYQLAPFSASYTADWKQLPISGSAERSLSQQSDQRWQLDFRASMLLASLTESSTFRLDNDAFLPLTYRFNRSGLGKAKQIEQDYDWKEKQVIGSNRGQAIRLPINPGMLDKSTYQLALQQDVADGKKSMSYQVVDGDELETYDFRVLGVERVRTQAGLLEAIKVERVRDPTQSSRKTVLWFAKDWDYLLVRLQQVEEDGKDYQIMLKEGEVNGRKVAGANN